MTENKPKHVCLEFMDMKVSLCDDSRSLEDLNQCALDDLGILINERLRLNDALAGDGGGGEGEVPPSPAGDLKQAEPQTTTHERELNRSYA